MLGDNIMTLPRELLILGAAVKSGMVEALRKTTTCDDLAQELALNPRAVWMVLEALADLGYVTKQGETVTLSEEALKMIYDPTAPNYMGFAFMHSYNVIRSWVQLPEILASGQPASKDNDPENTRYFMEGMRLGAEKIAPTIADFLLRDTGKVLRVLDIGGGPLIYGSAFTNSGAKVTVLDLPPVVQLMKEKAEKVGIVMFPGDFNVGLPSGPFDLAFLGNICHVFGEMENRELFRKVGYAAWCRKDCSYDRGFSAERHRQSVKSAGYRWRTANLRQRFYEQWCQGDRSGSASRGAINEGES